MSDTQGLNAITPGLVYSNTGASAQPYLRGVGTRFACAGLEPSVATYVDDRYLARAQAGIFEFADVERVEVLKGPQGTLVRAQCNRRRHPGGYAGCGRRVFRSSAGHGRRL